MNERRFLKFIITAALPAAFSIALGIFLFRSNAFNKLESGFQFVSFGVIGGIIYSSFRFLGRLKAVGIAVLLLVLDEVLLHSTYWSFILDLTLHYIGLCAVLYVSTVYFFRKLHGAAFGRLLILGALMGILYLIVAIIMYIAAKIVPSLPGVYLTQMIYYESAQGFLVGSGLGVGIELSEYFLSRLDLPQE